MLTCRSVQAVLILVSTAYFACCHLLSLNLILMSFFNIFLLCFFRNAYRAEVATFLVPVAGEDASASRLRERIEFSSNILFFIEDLYLALGPGRVTTQAGAKINVVASLLWVCNQHATNLKELMIAKKTGGRFSAISRASSILASASRWPRPSPPQTSPRRLRLSRKGLLLQLPPLHLRSGGLFNRAS